MWIVQTPVVSLVLLLVLMLLVLAMLRTVFIDVHVIFVRVSNIVVCVRRLRGRSVGAIQDVQLVVSICIGVSEGCERYL